MASIGNVRHKSSLFIITEVNHRASQESDDKIKIYYDIFPVACCKQIMKKNSIIITIVDHYLLIQICITLTDRTFWWLHSNLLFFSVKIPSVDYRGHERFLIQTFKCDNGMERWMQPGTHIHRKISHTFSANSSTWTQQAKISNVNMVKSHPMWYQR